jgi:YebC/PmpR family DNA-binding regulatory protein
MAGHSKWANIRVHKAAMDKKKGVAFSRAAKQIMSAVKQGGPDPEKNLKLVYAIEAAREVNMPRDSIDRAIKRAAGEGGDTLEAVVYEGRGPAGLAVIVEALTDNRHRTAPEMRKLFDDYGGALGAGGSCSYLFTAKARLVIAAAGISEDRAMEIAMETGADDYAKEGESWVLTGPPASLMAIRQALEKLKLKPVETAVAQIPNSKQEIRDPETARKALEFLEELDEHDDVEAVWSNLDIPDDVAAKL